MLAGLVGNGLGILLLGIGVIIMRHLEGGKKWEQHAMRGVILVMFLGGTAFLLTGIGSWIHSATVALLGLLGVKAAIVIGTLTFAFLLFEVVMGVWRKPKKRAAWSAVFLAFSLTLPLAAAPATFATQLRASANLYASDIGLKLGV